MPQGYLPFKYQEETKVTHMTALAGLPPYFELACIAGMADSIRKNVNVRNGSQGWTDTEQILSLILLNIAGGSCVDDVGILEGDRGLLLQRDSKRLGFADAYALNGKPPYGGGK